MAGVDWQAAYKDLESHIEHIMKETSQLVNNARPKLSINEIICEEKEGNLEIIIDGNGAHMMFALYLADRKGKYEMIKLPYQKSNRFTLNVPSSRYTVQGFIREDDEVGRVVSEKIVFKYDKVTENE